MTQHLSPEELWDLHGHALFSLARMLLGDDRAAGRAVTSGLQALFADHVDTGDLLVLPVAARYVFAHSEALRTRTCLTTLDTTRLNDLRQRRMLALCLFGSHNYQDAAAALGISHEQGAQLITTALKGER